MANRKQKAQPTSKSGNAAKLPVSSSAALLELKKELKVAKAQLEDAEYALEEAEWRYDSVERWVKQVQQKIKELKSGGIAV
jgi:predicted  nucleic acid-binding Zn-ribbon protein